MPKAFYQHSEVEKTKPRKPFSEAQKVYGKYLDDVPSKEEQKQEVKTDFDELLSYRNRRSSRFRRQHSWFMAYLGIAIVIVLWVCFEIFIAP